MYLAPKGYQVETDGWGVEKKCDTFTCKHCQKVTEVPVGTDPNEFWCQSCMAPICRRCKRNQWNQPPGLCTHFERRIAIAEARNQLWETLGLPG